MSNKVLIISNANELVRIKPERVVYVVSDGNYSTMVLHDKTEYVFTMNLAHCQQMMEYQLGFCGYFPADKPKYRMIVSLNKIGLPASGGGMAGDAFHNIVEWMIDNGMMK